MAIEWYVCRIKTHNLALCALRERKIETYAPSVAVECWRNHRQYVQRRPLFGPYILVAFDIDSNSWQIINTTMGVVRLLPMNREYPEPLPQGYVADLQAQERAAEDDFLTKAHDITRGYALNDYVEIKRGHAAGMGGTLIGFSKRNMVILLACFNSFTRVKIPPACVDPKERLQGVA